MLSRLPTPVLIEKLRRHDERGTPPPVDLLAELDRRGVLIGSAR